MNRGENTLLPDVCLETWTISYVAEQSILGSCANDDTNDASNIRRILFRFHRYKSLNFIFSAVLVVPLPFGVMGRMWNSIVSVFDHCLFIYYV